ncbi:MAG: glutamate--tRNA ligase [Candidatus Uhrbacteria bacterium]
MIVRTRFAPSPTGELHLGGLRSALYAFLLARHHGGQFIIRIEDTDQSRLVEGSLERLLDVLHAVGITWDEGPDIGGDVGPYVQSQRLERYRTYAERLVEEGSAYRCDCSTERLQELRAKQVEGKLPPRYDRHCCERSDVAKDGSVIRFRIPEGGSVHCEDLIHGAVEVRTDELDDFVILKSDGFPTYHLAHVIDDHEMCISHVTRGDEWLPSLPKHLLLFSAFGWDAPAYAHLPLLMGSGGKKLSKRDGDTNTAAYLEWCLPEALLNFVALLGWNPSGDREIYTIQELIEAFDIDHVNKSPAAVNFEKIEWMNGEYIRSIDISTLSIAVHARLHVDNTIDSEYLERVLTLEQPRMRRLNLLPMWYFKEWELNAPLAWKKSTTEEAEKLLGDLHGFLTELQDWPSRSEDVAKFENLVKQWITDRDLAPGAVLWPMRVALSGQDASPSPFELAWLFGREESLKRITRSLEHALK